MIENSEAKRNGEIDGLKPVADEDWRNILTTIYSRASRPYPGFWPIPESFWPDKNMCLYFIFNIYLINELLKNLDFDKTVF